jgi:two-component system phosphate regulon response regulator PhoB
VVPREQLIESVWGEVSDTAAASLDVLLTRIRRKLGPSASLLQTVRGVGYTFRCDP